MLAAATIGLWLMGRPGTVSRWRLASASALAAAGIGLLANQAIAHLWDRPRPSAAHAGEVHLFFVTPSQDPSFPSDHATGAFAIAFAVFLVSRRVGTGFLMAAAAVGLARILIGLHYPGDVAAGALVGLSAAALVHLVARGPLAHVVARAGRLTDPLLQPLWRVVEARRPGPRAGP